MNISAAAHNGSAGLSNGTFSNQPCAACEGVGISLASCRRDDQRHWLSQVQPLDALADYGGFIT